jgi:two-component system response regulator
MAEYEGFEILLVEDNPLDAELTIRSLKNRHLANSIFKVADGVEALDFLFCRGVYSERKVPETLRLILLDIKLPKIDGLDVLKEIKSDPVLKKIPTVVLSSSREDPDIQKAYALGANSYVVKPVDFDSFSKCVSDIGLYWTIVNQPNR